MSMEYIANFYCSNNAISRSTAKWNQFTWIQQEVEEIRKMLNSVVNRSKHNNCINEVIKCSKTFNEWYYTWSPVSSIRNWRKQSKLYSQIMRSNSASSIRSSCYVRAGIYIYDTNKLPCTTDIQNSSKRTSFCSFSQLQSCQDSSSLSIHQSTENRISRNKNPKLRSEVKKKHEFWKTKTNSEW